MDIRIDGTKYRSVIKWVMVGWVKNSKVDVIGSIKKVVDYVLRVSGYRFKKGLAPDW